MVDENLIKEIKAMRETGQGAPSDALKLMEFAKQNVEENEELKDELDDLDVILVQFVVTDVSYKYWVKMGEGKIEYGEGENADSKVIMSATQANWGSIGSGELEATSAYMSGDLSIEGNLQDAIAYGEVFGIAMEALQEALGE